MARVQGETGELVPPALLVHGGAGAFSAIERAEQAVDLTDALAGALEAGWQLLGQAGGAPGSAGDALDAVVAAVVSLEDSGRFNAGRGAAPTLDGKVELDASVMDTTGRLGAVAAVRYPANPVRLARLVAERGGLPDGPILLAGKGADAFARANGLERMKRWRLTGIKSASASRQQPGAGSRHGTVGAVAVDRKGRLAAATSTGGRSGQMPGRVGDTPVFGAGVWADRSTVAVSATGTGEVFVVVGFAHRIDWLLREGHDIGVAVDDALAHVVARGGEGGAVALRADGSFAARFSSRAMARGWRDRSGLVARVLDGGGPS
ncbi:MAG: isoaspartyl peptidase/L-asparaginase [Actinomycetota bacterium]|nr:isoaspartyl peptidase/L-asparaginase [Actinomycetota bacterium]